MLATQRGCIIHNGKLLSTAEADLLAQSMKFACAEDLVIHLEDEAYKKILAARKQTVPCGLCGTPTPMTGTERCDRCWELEKRVQADPVLAEKILKSIRISGATITNSSRL